MKGLGLSEELTTLHIDMSHLELSITHLSKDWRGTSGRPHKGTRMEVHGNVSKLCLRSKAKYILKLLFKNNNMIIWNFVYQRYIYIYILNEYIDVYVHPFSK